MKPGELIDGLHRHGVETVVIGGIAVRLHGGTRVTQDLDLAARRLDTDVAVRYMIDHGYALVTAVSENTVSLLVAMQSIDAWIGTERPDSLTFVERPNGLVGDDPTIPHRNLRIESQVDLLFDLAVPFARLKNNATTMQSAGVTVYVAAPRDLVTLKQARSDRSAADEADIAFLEGLM